MIFWKNKCRKREKCRKMWAEYAIRWGMLMSLFLLCCVTSVRAAEDEKLSQIADITDVKLHYENSNGEAGEEIKEGDLIKKGAVLSLRYDYAIKESEIDQIKADTPYYLEVSPHLVLPNLLSGEKLTINMEGVEKTFGRLYADQSSHKAWIEFTLGENGSGTVLSDLYQEGIILENAYFYLNCTRAGDPPADATQEEKNNNLYIIKFENNREVKIGYAELAPLHAEAKLKKDGAIADKTITWNIHYTPWQNPDETDQENGITSDTNFELRDKIDTTQHILKKDSLMIDGGAVPVYSSREDVPESAGEVYAFLDDTTLVIGGTKFKAGKATEAKPAAALRITYQTEICDALLLPVSGGGEQSRNNSDEKIKISNTAELFHKDGAALNIRDSASVDLAKPVWVKKEGSTTRTSGGGSVTEWTVQFFPNGFTFEEENALTLKDILPKTLPDETVLEKDSIQVTVDGVAVDKTKFQIKETSDGFTISPITTDNKKVVIKYNTTVPETVYDEGNSLGTNTAQFTFTYDSKAYATAEEKADTPTAEGGTGIATLVKECEDYDTASRSVQWTVTINPHKADFKSGTFKDDFSAVGEACRKHGLRGLELVGTADDVKILINGSEPTGTNPVSVAYDSNTRILTAEVGNIGTQTVKLIYTTKITDPCLFANNAEYAGLTNTISTTNMKIGTSDKERTASASSQVVFSAEVLKKRTPVYNYNTGRMTWTVDVNAANLSMEEIVLTDELPKGLTYVKDSLTPKAGTSAETAVGAEGRQVLTIKLDDFAQKTTLTFETDVNPEMLGFGGEKDVVIKNAIRMEGKADGIQFDTEHEAKQTITNHGLVKNSQVQDADELIEYEVLINPFGLKLPDTPTIVDKMDKRLQLDWDTLYFYQVELNGTIQKGTEGPTYTKKGNGTQLSVEDYDPETNSFTVKLPISENDTGSYVLVYKADIIDYQMGSYGNSVSFNGSTLLLGGSKNNSASVGAGGGGGGGGGGVAARKASISITKKDLADHTPLAGVRFALYQWNSKTGRGKQFAEAVTDADGKLRFLVKPAAVYELVEKESLPGYKKKFECETLPEGVSKTKEGLLITAGAKGSNMELQLTNEAGTSNTTLWDLTIQKVSADQKTPLSGAKFGLYEDKDCRILLQEGISDKNGTIVFSDLEEEEIYYLKEIKAPSGYQLNTKVYTVRESEPKLTIENEPLQDENESVSPKSVIEVVKKDHVRGTPLSGVGFTLYQWDNKNGRGEIFAETVTDEEGKLRFSVEAGDLYELVETKSLPGYRTDLKYEALPVGVTKTEQGLLILAPEEGLRLELLLTNEEENNTGGSENNTGGSGNDNSSNENDNGNGGEAGEENERPELDSSKLPHLEGRIEVLDELEEETETKDDSNVSANPANADRFNASDNGNSAENADASAHTDILKNLDIPQTGDLTWWLGGVTLLAGLLVAGSTVYQLRRRKKHGKK